MDPFGRRPGAYPRDRFESRQDPYDRFGRRDNRLEQQFSSPRPESYMDRYDRSRFAAESASFNDWPSIDRPSSYDRPPLPRQTYDDRQSFNRGSFNDRPLLDRPLLGRQSYDDRRKSFDLPLLDEPFSNNRSFTGGSRDHNQRRDSSYERGVNYNRSESGPRGNYHNNRGRNTQNQAKYKSDSTQDKDKVSSVQVSTETVSTKDKNQESLSEDKDDKPTPEDIPKENGGSSKVGKDEASTEKNIPKSEIPPDSEQPTSTAGKTSNPDEKSPDTKSKSDSEVKQVGGTQKEISSEEKSTAEVEAPQSETTNSSKGISTSKVTESKTNSSKGKSTAEVTKIEASQSQTTPNSSKGKSTAEVTKIEVSQIQTTPNSSKGKSTTEVIKIEVSQSETTPNSSKGKSSAEVRKIEVSQSQTTPNSSKGKSTAEVTKIEGSQSQTTPKSSKGKSTSKVTEILQSQSRTTPLKGSDSVDMKPEDKDGRKASNEQEENDKETNQEEPMETENVEVKENEEEEMEEEEEDDDEQDTSYCKLCNIRFTKEPMYWIHQRSVGHLQRVISGEKAPTSKSPKKLPLREQPQKPTQTKQAPPVSKSSIKPQAVNAGMREEKKQPSEIAKPGDKSAVKSKEDKTSMTIPKMVEPGNISTDKASKDDNKYSPGIGAPSTRDSATKPQNLPQRDNATKPADRPSVDKTGDQKKQEKSSQEVDHDDGDDDDEEEENWRFCNICNQSFTQSGSYWIHTRGIGHYQRVLEQGKGSDDSAKKPETLADKPARSTIKVGSFGITSIGFYCEVCEMSFTSDKALDIHENGQSHKDTKARAEGRLPPKPPTDQIDVELLKQSRPQFSQDKDWDPDELSSSANQYCEVCGITTNGVKSFETHLRGQKHIKKLRALKSAEHVRELEKTINAEIMSSDDLLKKKKKRVCRIQLDIDQCKEPLIGLDYLTEFQKEDSMVEPQYICELCEVRMDGRQVMPHLTGLKHRVKYFKFHSPRDYEFLFSKKKKSEKTRLAAHAAEVIQEVEGRHKVRLKIARKVFEGPGGSLGNKETKEDEMDKDDDWEEIQIDGARSKRDLPGLQKYVQLSKFAVERPGEEEVDALPETGGRFGGYGDSKQEDQRRPDLRRGDFRRDDPYDRRLPDRYADPYSPDPYRRPAPDPYGRALPYDRMDAYTRDLLRRQQFYRARAAGIPPSRIMLDYSRPAAAEYAQPESTTVTAPSQVIDYGHGKTATTISSGDVGGDNSNDSLGSFASRRHKSEQTWNKIGDNQGQLDVPDQQKVMEILDGLCEVGSEEDAEVALQVSNALTKALLDFRMKAVNQMPQGTMESVVKKTLADLAKKADTIQIPHKHQEDASGLKMPSHQSAGPSPGTPRSILKKRPAEPEPEKEAEPEKELPKENLSIAAFYAKRTAGISADSKPVSPLLSTKEPLVSIKDQGNAFNDQRMVDSPLPGAGWGSQAVRPRGQGGQAVRPLMSFDLPKPNMPQGQLAGSSAPGQQRPNQGVRQPRMPIRETQQFSEKKPGMYEQQNTESGNMQFQQNQTSQFDNQGMPPNLGSRAPHRFPPPTQQGPNQYGSPQQEFQQPGTDTTQAEYQPQQQIGNQKKPLVAYKSDFDDDFGDFEEEEHEDLEEEHESNYQYDDYNYDGYEQSDDQYGQYQDHAAAHGTQGPRLNAPGPQNPQAPGAVQFPHPSGFGSQAHTRYQAPGARPPARGTAPARPRVPLAGARPGAPAPYPSYPQDYNQHGTWPQQQGPQNPYPGMGPNQGPAPYRFPPGPNQYRVPQPPYADPQQEIQQPSSDTTQAEDQPADEDPTRRDPLTGNYVDTAAAAAAYSSSPAQYTQAHQQQYPGYNTQYSTAMYPQGQYPPQSQAGYPPQSQAGYPPQSQAGYPQQAQAGYPQQAQAGYPQQAQAGYPQGYGQYPPAATQYPGTPQQQQASAQAHAQYQAQLQQYNLAMSQYHASQAQSASTATTAQYAAPVNSTQATAQYTTPAASQSSTTTSSTTPQSASNAVPSFDAASLAKLAKDPQAYYAAYALAMSNLNPTQKAQAAAAGLYQPKTQPQPPPAPQAAPPQPQGAPTSQSAGNAVPSFDAASLAKLAKDPQAYYAAYALAMSNLNPAQKAQAAAAGLYQPKTQPQPPPAPQGAPPQPQGAPPQPQGAPPPPHGAPPPPYGAPPPPQGAPPPLPSEPPPPAPPPPDSPEPKAKKQKRK